MVFSGMLRRVALVRTDLVVLRSVRRLLVAASVVPSSPILVPLMKQPNFLPTAGNNKTHTV
jgi:hypothetical protein